MLYKGPTVFQLMCFCSCVICSCHILLENSWSCQIIVLLLKYIAMPMDLVISLLSKNKHAEFSLVAFS